VAYNNNNNNWLGWANDGLGRADSGIDIITGKYFIVLLLHFASDILFYCVCRFFFSTTTTAHHDSTRA
jgi:hypothetical protein